MEQSDNQHIGAKIKSIIEDSQYSVKEIAQLMDTSFQNIYRILEKESVETKHLFKLSEILKVPISRFFGDVDTTELESEITGFERKLEEKEKEIISLKEKNDMLGKLLESNETQLKKRIESNTWLASLFNVLDDPKYKDLGGNISARLFTFAKDLLKEGDVNAYQLVSKISTDPEMVRLIELANKKTPRSI